MRSGRECVADGQSPQKGNNGSMGGWLRSKLFRGGVGQSQETCGGGKIIRKGSDQGIGMPPSHRPKDGAR